MALDFILSENLIDLQVNFKMSELWLDKVLFIKFHKSKKLANFDERLRCEFWELGYKT